MYQQDLVRRSSVRLYCYHTHTHYNLKPIGWSFRAPAVGLLDQSEAELLAKVFRQGREVNLRFELSLTLIDVDLNLSNLGRIIL